MRNVTVWDISGAERREVAGFWQHGNTSNALFLEWLTQLLVFGHEGDPAGAADWGLYPLDDIVSDVEHPQSLQERPAEDAVPIGDYTVLSRASRTPVRVSEVSVVFPPPRPYSPDPKYSDRPPTLFESAVKQRDGAVCTICGLSYRVIAAHIMPRVYAQLWREHGFDQAVADSPGCGQHRLDSVQNGLTLCPICHNRWDAHLFTVNVDDDYQIIDFFEQPSTIFDRKLQLNGQPDQRPLDDLLRWHYGYTILVNVRGSFPPHIANANDQGLWTLDVDDMFLGDDEDWIDGPGKQFIETELANRLNHLAP